MSIHLFLRQNSSCLYFNPVALANRMRGLFCVIVGLNKARVSLAVPLLACLNCNFTLDFGLRTNSCTGLYGLPASQLVAVRCGLLYL